MCESCRISFRRVFLLNLALRILDPIVAKFKVFRLVETQVSYIWFRKPILGLLIWKAVITQYFILLIFLNEIVQKWILKVKQQNNFSLRGIQKNLLIFPFLMVCSELHHIKNQRSQFIIYQRSIISMKFVQNSKFKKDLEQTFKKTLKMPILDTQLHPCGIWAPKRYTKKIISKAIKLLQSNDADNIENDVL